MTWWVLTFLYNSRASTTLYTLAWTNRDAHLFMAWANYRPARQKVYKNVRGVSVHCGYRWIWDTPNITEQSESGDTYTHTFTLAGLDPADHLWYYLFSLAPDPANQCQGPLIHVPPPEVPVPSARVFHSAIQHIPTDVWTTLTFDSQRYDTDNMHDPAANPSRLTIRTPGKYSIKGHVSITVAVAGFRALRLMLNATTEIARVTLPTVTVPRNTTLLIATDWECAANDYIQLEVEQSSGVPLAVYPEPAWSPEFMIHLFALP